MNAPMPCNSRWMQIYESVIEDYPAHASREDAIARLASLGLTRPEAEAELDGLTGGLPPSTEGAADV